MQNRRKPSPNRRAEQNGDDVASARPLRVLHLITRLDRGGSAENTLLTVIGLARRGYAVALASGNSAESRMTPGEISSLKARLAEAREAGAQVIVLPSLRRQISPLRDLAALIGLIRLIRRFSPDIVHTHTSKAGALGRLAAWVCRAPVVIHTPHGHIFYGYYGPWITAAIVAVERGLGRLTHGLITLTDVGKQDYLDRRIIAADRLHAIPSGIDLTAFRNGPGRFPKPPAYAVGGGVDWNRRVHSAETKARRMIGLPSQGPVIGVVGRLVPIKGHRYLIDALPAILHEFPKARLLFVGEGDERARLARQAAQLGVADHLHLVGAQPELRRYFAACDLIVQPSLNEGMGRTVVEALVMGKPVVASRVGGLPELIHQGRNGLLVPPASPAALAEAVCSLLRDQVRLRRMGEAARRSVTSRYTTMAMVDAIDRLYRWLAYRRSAANTAPAKAVAPSRARPHSRIPKRD
ncbi:MAG: glycosyltransferase family 4 protein [Nitrospirota bacterium]